MRKILSWLTLCFLVAVSRIGAPAAVPANLADLLPDFRPPPDDARIMVRWWWFGPSVEKPELEREMRFMKEGGMGGVEVQPVYPLELDNPATGVHNFRYLSDEFLEDLRFAGAKAKELGLRFDLTVDSGWPFGGPHIPLNLAAGRLRIVRGGAPQLTGGQFASLDSPNESGSSSRAVWADCMPFDTPQDGECLGLAFDRQGRKRVAPPQRFSR